MGLTLGVGTGPRAAPGTGARGDDRAEVVGSRAGGAELVAGARLASQARRCGIAFGFR